MPLLAVSAHDIDTAGLTLRDALPTAWLNEELADAGFTATQPGKVDIRLSRSGHDVVVRGKVSAKLTTPCARCLDPAHVSIATELSLLLQPAHTSSAHAGSREEEYEFTAEEADFDTFDGETVVLDPFVREAILLEVPNFPLCSDDCAGIRDVPAAPPAEVPHDDPRLAPIAALRDKLKAGGQQHSPPSHDGVRSDPTPTWKKKE